MKLTFKIKLAHSREPEIWRRFSVPGNYTFTQLHYVIQIVMGWTNSHLWQFDDQVDDEKHFQDYTFYITDEPSPYDDEMDVTFRNANEIRLCDFFRKVGQRLNYLYDMGDNWCHNLVLEEISDGNPRKATCIEGAGMCPAEDVGGIHGWEHLKNVFDHPRKYREELESYIMWLGLDENEYLDPYYFSKTAVNNFLTELYHNPNLLNPYGNA